MLGWDSLDFDKLSRIAGAGINNSVGGDGVLLCNDSGNVSSTCINRIAFGSHFFVLGFWLSICVDNLAVHYVCLYSRDVNVVCMFMWVKGPMSILIILFENGFSHLKLSSVELLRHHHSR